MKKEEDKIEEGAVANTAGALAIMVAQMFAANPGLADENPEVANLVRQEQSDPVTGGMDMSIRGKAATVRGGQQMDHDISTGELNADSIRSIVDNGGIIELGKPYELDGDDIKIFTDASNGSIMDSSSTSLSKALDTLGATPEMRKLYDVILKALVRYEDDGSSDIMNVDDLYASAVKRVGTYITDTTMTFSTKFDDGFLGAKMVINISPSMLTAFREGIADMEGFVIPVEVVETPGAGNIVVYNIIPPTEWASNDGFGAAEFTAWASKNHTMVQKMNGTGLEESTLATANRFMALWS